MTLSNDLISQFVKVTNDEPEVKSSSSQHFGTIVERDGRKFVQLDGSELFTPIQSTTEVEVGERVTVTINNHSAIATGNMSSPSVRKATVDDIGNRISEAEILIADKVDAIALAAQAARIDKVVADNVTINEKLTAHDASIENVVADNVTINETLKAHDADIENLDAHKLDVTDAAATYATITNLDATNAKIHKLDSTYAKITDLEATDAKIKKLDAAVFDAESGNIKFANIDFSNIGEAAFEHFYANSGLIKDVVVDNGTVTGELVGVTIKGDLIEGGTVKADKLVIKGTDGLYYKLNTDGETVETEQTEYNSLDGSHILTKSITANKVNVTDLVAFGATIGGFKITNNSIYSGVKESINNTTRGIYMDNAGQIVFGDETNFIKYYQTDETKYKLEITADKFIFSSTNKTVEQTIDDVKKDVDTLRDEITTLLRIESSRGTVFKNDNIATVLSVVIYHGTERITDSATMKTVFGNSAYLQWKWQRLDEDTYGIISSSDTRFGDNGFTFTLSPEDVDTKVTFMCELIV